MDNASRRLLDDLNVGDRVHLRLHAGADAWGHFQGFCRRGEVWMMILSSKLAGDGATCVVQTSEIFRVVASKASLA